MLISDNHKFLFIAIPKTGTHSVRSILKKYSTDEHVGNGGGVSTPHKSKFTEFANIQHGHLTIQEMKKVVDISKYFSFCVFRNPYSRAVSLWSFYNKNCVVKPNILEYFKNPKVFERILFKPQSYFILNENNEIGVDYIIKFEDYQNGLNFVLNKLELPNVTLPVVNESSHDSYEKYYEEYPELKKIIEERYSMDFVIWNQL